MKGKFKNIGRTRKDKSKEIDKMRREITRKIEVEMKEEEEEKEEDEEEEGDFIVKEERKLNNEVGCNQENNWKNKKRKLGKNKEWRKGEKKKEWKDGMEGEERKKLVEG